LVSPSLLPPPPAALTALSLSLSLSLSLTLTHHSLSLSLSSREEPAGITASFYLRAITPGLADSAVFAMSWVSLASFTGFGGEYTMEMAGNYYAIVSLVDDVDPTNSVTELALAAGYTFTTLTATVTNTAQSQVCGK
jgi:hypothetical protein